jgi:hypothetical protein
MKKGDIVMFMDKGRYAKWFFGQIGVIDLDPKESPEGRVSVSVSWLRPVKYFDRYTPQSHFSADKFRVICGNR